jgi:type I restriction enzyme S subunit
MEAVTETGRVNIEEVRQIGDVYNGYTYFGDGDVLVAKITPCFENGKRGRVIGLRNGIGFGTTELHVLRPSRKINRDYLFYLISTDRFRHEGQAEMRGAAGQQRVPTDYIRSFVVPLPSIPEQCAIAAFLDRETEKIDALIENKERIIKLLEEKRQTIIAHAVTKGLDPNARMKHSGVVWLGEIPEHWEVTQLRYLVREGTTITYGIVQAGPDVEDGVPYIRTSDMAGDHLPREGYLRTSHEIDTSYVRSKVSTGDVVIAIRATIGKPLIVPPYLDGANLTQGTAKFSPGPSVIAEFICLFLRSPQAIGQFERLSKGATFKEITLEMLRKFDVSLPPVLEQNEIVGSMSAQLAKLGRLLTETERAIVLLQERRAALISAAITGRIDVRSADATEEPLEAAQ